MMIPDILDKIMLESIALLFTLLVTIISKRIRDDPPKIWFNPKTWKKIAIVLMFIFLIISLILVGIIIMNILIPPPIDIAITDPINGESVDIIHVVRGTAYGIPKDEVMWIVVYCPSTGRYYPQNGSFESNEVGEWEFKTYIGLKNDSGLDFEVKVILADSSAQKTLNDYLLTSESMGKWEGINNLPIGAKSYAFVKVRRN